MKFDRGFISPYFITNPKLQKCELDNPYILIHEKKISGLNTLLPVLENVLRQQRPLVIIAEGNLNFIHTQTHTKKGIRAIDH